MELRLGSGGDAVRMLQEQLFGLNYYRGEIDGRFGKATEAAVKSYQADCGLPATGIVDSRTWYAKPSLEPTAGKLTWLIPLIAVAGVWALGNRLRSRLVGGESSVLSDAVKAVLQPEQDVAWVVADVASRSTWMPYLTVFAVIAVAVGAAMALLLYRAIHESDFWLKRRFPVVDRQPLLIGLSIIAAVLLFVFGALREPGYLPLTSVLLPFANAFLSREVAFWVSTSQAVFRGLAFAASVFVLLVATAAMFRSNGDAVQHLSDQWRRLTWALYGGALLLVTALLFQASVYGSLSAVPEATSAQTLRHVRLATLHMDSIRSQLATARIDFQMDSLRIDSKAKASGSPANFDSALAARDSTVEAGERALLAAALDTMNARSRSASVTETMQHVGRLVDASVIRAGGMTYSFLLALLYFPAALVLRHRARKLSPGATEAARRKWRDDHGLTFAFSTQWVKALAVLSPLFVSIPAAQYILKLFE